MKPQESHRIPLLTQIWSPKFVDKPKHAGDWFSDRGLNRSFAQLAAFTLTDFERVVILDGDTLMLESCEELFQLPLLVAAAPETHRALLESFGSLKRR